MGTVERFREAISAGDLAALPPLFAPDVRFFSPAKFTPFEGSEQAVGLLSHVLRAFSEFRYVGEFRGIADFIDSDTVLDSHILEFRARVDGKQAQGIDLIRLNSDDLIREFTVLVRPASALLALGQAVQAELDR